jgi:hypothetical protein
MRAELFSKIYNTLKILLASAENNVSLWMILTFPAQIFQNLATLSHYFTVQTLHIDLLLQFFIIKFKYEDEESNQKKKWTRQLLLINSTCTINLKMPSK